MSWIKDLGVLVKETDIVNKVSSAVDVIATKLGVAAVHVYEVFTKQVIAESIARIVLYGAYGTVCFVSAILFWQMRKTAEWNSNGDPNNAQGWIQIISGIVFCAAFVIGGLYFLGTITNTVTGLINPEYRVIHEIADIVNGATTQKK